MKKLALGLLAALAVSATQAGVIPSGIQTDVTGATVASWGWTECSRTDALGSASTTTVLSSCAGDYLAMGIWDASRGVYGVVGMGAYSVVSAVTYADYYGDDNGTVQNWSNGLNWYRTSGFGSWGFTTAKETALNSADINLLDGLNDFDGAGTKETTLARGVSFHLDDAGNLMWGWAFNATGSNFTGMNYGDQRVFWTLNAPKDVPEPASIALLGAALAGLGLARRKSK